MKIVIKVGTSTITSSDGSLNQKYISRFTDMVVDLQRLKCKVLIVSSGAISAGRYSLKLKNRTNNLSEKQALAAVGQPYVMNAYSQSFSRRSKSVAQVLLTRTDFDSRLSCLNLRNTLNALMNLNVTPIINENDTTAVDEIKLGDNDSLAAFVAVAVKAQKLIIFTDVDGFHAGNPIKTPLIKTINKITKKIENYANENSSSNKGTGGMKTKIYAAKIASLSGIETLITQGSNILDLKDFVLTGKTEKGTIIKPLVSDIKKKKK
jgi:glutamate 5-kinase